MLLFQVEIEYRHTRTDNRHDPFLSWNRDSFLRSRTRDQSSKTFVEQGTGMDERRASKPEELPSHSVVSKYRQEVSHRIRDTPLWTMGGLTQANFNHRV